MLDGAHAEIRCKNLVCLFKIYKVPKYGIWAMMKNKEPRFIYKTI